MGHKKLHRPYGWCLGALAVTITVFVAGQLFLRMAYPRNAVAFRLEEGDAANLQGFTLQGLWRQSETAMLSFTLKDGEMSTKPRLSNSESDTTWMMARCNLCVPEEDWQEVDAAAEGSYVSGAYGAYFLKTSYEGMQYNAQVTHLEAMYTLTAADGTDRSVRFSLGELETAEPVTVTAELYSEKGNQESYGYFVSAGAVQDVDADIRDVQVLSSTDQVALYIQGGNGKSGGIYCVRKFCTSDEIRKQVPEVTVHGVAVPSQTEPYGSIEEVCSFEEGEEMVVCDNQENTRLRTGRWMLTQTQDGTLFLRLLDEEWRPMNRIELDTKLTAGQTVTALPAMRSDEIVFTVADESGAGKTVLLRMQDGNIGMQEELALVPESPPITAGFSEDGSRIMTVQETKEELISTVPSTVQEHYLSSQSLAEELQCSAMAVTGWQIQVYSSQNSATPVLTASLEYGLPQRWREEVWMNGIYDSERTIYLFRVIPAWQTEEAPA